MCAAATICRYYGTSINIDTAHGNLTTSQHNVHTLAACPGGNGLEACQVIYTYTGKNGTSYENSLSASATMLYFGGTTPIYTGWFHYNNAQPVFPGHAMVLCGYIFDTVSLDFTYEFRDSDPYDQSEVYIISTFNASTVSYYSLGESYVWHLSIYNWN